MNVLNLIKVALGFTESVVEIADDMIDSGNRQCRDGELCEDATCTHKDPHKANTGCANACFKNGRQCDIIFKQRESRR